MHRIKRWRAALQIDQRLKQIAAGFAKKNEKADDQQDSDHVPTAELTRPAADRYRDKHSHASNPAVIELSRMIATEQHPQSPAIPYHRGGAVQIILLAKARES